MFVAEQISLTKSGPLYLMAACTQKSFAERNRAREVSPQFFEYSLRLRKLFQNAVLFCNRIPIRVM